MPNDIPYGPTITADRAAQVVAAVIAEATRALRNWKLAIAVVDPNGDLVYFYKMDPDAVRLAHDRGGNGSHGRPYPAPDAGLLRSHANPGRLFRSHARSHPDRLSRGHSPHRRRADHRGDRLQRRERRAGSGRLHRWREHGAINGGADALEPIPCAPARRQAGENQDKPQDCSRSAGNSLSTQGPPWTSRHRAAFCPQSAPRGPGRVPLSAPV